MPHQAPAVTRRTALRLACGAALAAAAAGRLAAPARAARTWCKTDPVVKIDGKIADIWLGSYTDLHGAATGPAEIQVGVPVGVPTELLATDPGFGRLGYVVSFYQDPGLNKDKGNVQVRIAVFVPSSDGTLPLTVDFAPRSSGLAAASASGYVNAWVSLESGYAESGTRIKAR
jgi:hypothetical protein